MAVKPLFVQPNISWLHYLHFVFEPIIIFMSISDVTYFLVVSSYVALGLLAIDGIVIGISFLALSRCYLEPTAYCIGRLYENGVWVLLGFFFCVHYLWVFLYQKFQKLFE